MHLVSLQQEIDAANANPPTVDPTDNSAATSDSASDPIRQITYNN